jgi:Integral membrane protein possibly involved in chromosome condensation
MSYLEKNSFSENFIRYFIIIGLLGSYTIFSTFSFEIIDLFNNRKVYISFLYILITVTSCLVFAYLGYNINKI